METVNLDLTRRLIQLLQASPDLRDEPWQQEFSKTVMVAPMHTTQPQEVFLGPDGFYYFGLYFPQPPDFRAVTGESALDYMIEHHLGVALGESQEKVWFVIDQGLVLSYKLYGSLYYTWTGEWGKNRVGNRVLQEETQTKVGESSDEMLPQLAREYLRFALRNALKIEEPKVLLVQFESQPPDLIFNVFRDEFASDEEFERAGDIVMRFLPSPQRKRTIFMNRDAFPESQFFPL